MEKAWLSQQGVDFEDRNIAEDQKAMGELQALNVYSTPATLIDDELVIGFDQDKLRSLLGLSQE